MTRQKLLEKIEEITDKNNNLFKGSNEAELHTREDIADLFEILMQIENIKYQKILGEFEGVLQGVLGWDNINSELVRIITAKIADLKQK